MSGFLYFVPGVQALADGDLGRWRLQYPFDVTPASAQLSGRTPTGTPGLLIADQHRLGNLTFGYFADEQTWERRPRRQQGPDVYVGYYKAHKPRPAHLLREKGLSGDLVELADRNQWRIPRLRLWTEEDGFTTALPRMVDMDDDGKLVPGETVDRWRHLDAINTRLWAALAEAPLGNAPQLTTEEAVRISADLIGVNYVVSLFELTKLLRVFSEERSVIASCHAAQTWPRFVAWYEKKNQAASQPISTG